MLSNFSCVFDHIIACDGRCTFCWSGQRAEHPDDGGFARPVWSEQSEDFSFFDGEGDVVDRWEIPEEFAEMGDFYGVTVHGSLLGGAWDGDLSFCVAFLAGHDELFPGCAYVSPDGVAVGAFELVGGRFWLVLFHGDHFFFIFVFIVSICLLIWSRKVLIDSGLTRPMR